MCVTFFSFWCLKQSSKEANQCRTCFRIFTYQSSLRKHEAKCSAAGNVQGVSDNQPKRTPRSCRIHSSPGKAPSRCRTRVVPSKANNSWSAKRKRQSEASHVGPAPACSPPQTSAIAGSSGVGEATKSTEQTFCVAEAPAPVSVTTFTDVLCPDKKRRLNAAINSLSSSTTCIPGQIVQAAPNPDDNQDIAADGLGSSSMSGPNHPSCDWSVSAEHSSWGWSRRVNQRHEVLAHELLGELVAVLQTGWCQAGQASPTMRWLRSRLRLDFDDLWWRGYAERQLQTLIVRCSESELQMVEQNLYWERSGRSGAAAAAVRAHMESAPIQVPVKLELAPVRSVYRFMDERNLQASTCSTEVKFY